MVYIYFEFFVGSRNSGSTMGNIYSHESEEDLFASTDKLNYWFQAVDSYARRDALGMAKNNMSFESVVSLSAHSSHSSASSDPWGWFTEDVEYRFDAKGASIEVVKQADAQVAAEARLVATRGTSRGRQDLDVSVRRVRPARPDCLSSSPG